MQICACRMNEKNMCGLAQRNNTATEVITLYDMRGRIMIKDTKSNFWQFSTNTTVTCSTLITKNPLSLFAGTTFHQPKQTDKHLLESVNQQELFRLICFIHC